MSQQAIIQRAIRRNAKEISLLHYDLYANKAFKAIADERKDIESEYFYHKMVKYTRQVKDLIDKEVESKQIQITTAQRSINISSALLKDKQTALSILYSVCAHEYVYEYTCRNKGDMSRCTICGGTF